MEVNMPNRDGSGPPDGSGLGKGMGNCGKSRNSQNTGTQQSSSSSALVDIGAQLLLSIIRALTSKKTDKK
jgi:hypothetical protein